MSTEQGQSAQHGREAEEDADRPRLPTPPPAHAAPLPKTIGKYTVLARIGVGAMGVVYKCSQPGLNRPVAVKVLSYSRHALSDVLPRFQREARAASRLNHPSVVQVYDIDTEGELHYIVMEFVDGWSLDKVIGSPALTVDYTLRLLIHIARALQAAHENGIVHRDIKPSNILIHRSGQPKLADFGLAKSLHDGSTISRSGDILGTPRYMSPEQVLMAPRDLDARTDIYSLGAVMYEMLTAKPPVEGQNVMAMLRCLTDEEVIPVRMRNSAVPEAVAAICHKALAKERDDRYSTAAQLAEAMQHVLLERYLGSPPPIGAPAKPTNGEPFGDVPILPTLPSPSSVRGIRRPGAWRRRAMFAGTLLSALLTLALVTGWPARWVADYWNTRSADHPANTSALDLLLLQSRQHLEGTASLRAAATPRERLQALVDDLSAVRQRTPGRVEIYGLRARAYRLAGEYLAAADDLTVVLATQPDNQAARLERLLANYQLSVLYLGNCNELLLRPVGDPHIREDLDRLLPAENSVVHYAARLIDALARHDLSTAVQLAEVGMPVNVPRENVPDLAMLQADALYHAVSAALVEEAAAADDQKAMKRHRREELADKASNALRRGLNADAHHVGLLFLLANSFQRRADWEAADAQDRDKTLRRHRAEFEESCERLRQVTLRLGPDTSVARAVLWNNFDRADMALEHLKDAISCRPAFRYLYTLKAWLAMHDQPDGVLSAEEIGRILRDLQPVFETPPDNFNPYFIRALLEATLGRWQEARADLLQCSRRLGPNRVPSDVAVHNAWFSRAGATTTEFLDYTQTLVENLPVPPELRIRLAEEVLRTLADDEVVQRDKLDETMLRIKKGWTHHRLARLFAEKKDPGNTLPHVRAALEQRLPNLTPETFQNDGAFTDLNRDADFKKLYAMFMEEGKVD